MTKIIDNTEETIDKTEEIKTDTIKKETKDLTKTNDTKTDTKTNINTTKKDTKKVNKTKSALESKDIVINSTIPTLNTAKSQGSRKYLLKEMPVNEIKTLAAFEALSGPELMTLVINPNDTAVNRFSRESARSGVAAKIRSGNIPVDSLAFLKLLAGKQAEMTEEAFGELDNDAKATIVGSKNNALKTKIADKLLPEFIRQGMSVKAQEIVNWTQGRVAIAGLTPERSHTTDGSSDNYKEILSEVKFT